jgi:hypothetical protein
LVTGITAFFVRGAAASLLVWLASGLVLAWFTSAWALIYRGPNATVDDPDPAAEPEPVAAVAIDSAAEDP